MIHVLDAGPMMALLEGEQGDQIVAQTLIANSGKCFAHVFNLAEVYYLFFVGAEQAVPKQRFRLC